MKKLVSILVSRKRMLKATSTEYKCKFTET